MGQKYLLRKSFCVLSILLLHFMCFLLDIHKHPHLHKQPNASEHSDHPKTRGPWTQTWLMMMTSETLTGQAPQYCRKFPSTHRVSHHIQAFADVSTQLCGRWFQTQTTAVSAEGLCCCASGSVVCVEAGKCQGWFRSDQIWNVSGCSMCTDVRSLEWTAQSWMELMTIQKSWFFNQEGQHMPVCAKMTC